MNCHEAGRHLPGYLDGAVESGILFGLRQHLEGCQKCRGEADRYRLMLRALGNLEPMPVPRDLVVKIRIQASKAPWQMMLHRIRSRFAMLFGNILAPLAIPATGGVLTALGVFVLMLQSLMVGVPLGGVVVNDTPLHYVQPAYLVSLGPIPAPTFDELTVDTTVNARGQMVDYHILSGPTGTEVMRQIDQVMMTSQFHPALHDGEPANGGHVVLNFSALNTIRVKG